MKVTFLGTGTSQGVPVITCSCEVCLSDNSKDNRLRSSVLIESKGLSFVIDSGPDFRQQMLRSKCKSLDAVLLTHEHIDHIAGLDDIRAFNFFHKKPMDIYAEKRVHTAIERMYSYVFAEEKYPGIPLMNLIEIENKPFKISETHITPIRGMHLRLPVFGYRIGDFAYLTDMNFIDKEELNKLKGLDVLVINALRKKKHISHFCLDDALELISYLKPKMSYLTHLSHYIGLHFEIESELPKNVALAYDGLSFTI